MNEDYPEHGGASYEGPSRGEIALWRSMVARASRSGVRYEDAQDLASEAVRKALAAHEPGRGPFGPFCRAIHANLLKNYWRDRKSTVELDPEMDDRESGSNPLDEVAFEEGREMMRRIADRILETLDPQEAAFFLALAEACQDVESVAVTAAARRLGIDPIEGWNRFRRIQRKARRHMGEYEITMESRPAEPLREAPAASLPPMLDALAIPDEGDGLLLAVAGSTSAGYERFAARLDEEERRRLSALLA